LTRDIASSSSSVLLSALSECPVVRVFSLLSACIFLCLSVYFVSFVLLLDSSTLGLHFLCVQGVFSVSCVCCQAGVLCFGHVCGSNGICCVCFLFLSIYLVFYLQFI
jgi:hypothetical protein